MSKETIDVIIVGGGVAGVSLAYRLAPHRSVRILEQESQIAYHASGRSAAMYMETYGTPSVRALTRAGRQFFENAVSSGFSPEPILHSRGCIYVGNAEREQTVRDFYNELAKQHFNVELIDGDRIMALAPCMKADMAHLAVYEPEADDIDTDLLMQSYLKGARLHNAHISYNAHLQSARFDDGIWTVQLGNGSGLTGKVLVNAAGAWVDDVAIACGVKPLGFEPRRRSAFTFDAPPELNLRTLPMIVDIDETYYIKPDAGQVLGSSANADPTFPHDVVAEEIDIATGIYYIEENTNLKIRRPKNTWAGLRTFAPDNDLVLGFDGAVPSFFWLAGQGGYGMQSSAGVSELAADIILDRPLSDTLTQEQLDIKAISPTRFV